MFKRVCTFFIGILERKVRLNVAAKSLDKDVDSRLNV